MKDYICFTDVLLKTLCSFTIKPLYVPLVSRELASAKFFKINNILFTTSIKNAMQAKYGVVSNNIEKSKTKVS